MKPIVFVFVFFLQMNTRSQDKLNTITAPASPASFVIGLQPSAVLLPKTYRAFETALFTGIQNGSAFSIPNDFALEFSPYWAKDHNLTIEEYLFPRSFWEQWKRGSSISLASSRDYLFGDSSNGHAIGLGYRTTVFFGGKNDRDSIEQYRKSITLSKKISAGIGAQAEQIATSATSNEQFFLSIEPVMERRLVDLNYPKSKDLVKRIGIKLRNNLKKDVKGNPDDFLDAFYNIIDEELASASTFNAFKSYIKNRTGFSLDLAYAGMINFPTGNFDKAFSPRHSIWLTPSYRLGGELGFLKLNGVIRYEFLNQDFYKNYFQGKKVFNHQKDFGLSISADFLKFSLQFEAVGRYASSELEAGMDGSGNVLYRKEKDNDLQYIGSFSYHISSQVALTYNLGKKFDPLYNPLETLVSLLTLNLGFGSPTTDHVK